MKLKKLIDIRSDEDLTKALNHILQRIDDLEDQVAHMDDEIHALYDAIPGVQSEELN